MGRASGCPVRPSLSRGSSISPVEQRLSGRDLCSPEGLLRSLALQNIALHNRLFMDDGAAPPLYLHVPGIVMKAEGVDDFSRSAA